MKLNEIQKTPTTLNNVHESAFRSYHILDQVLTMVERGDSKEMILEVTDMLRENLTDIYENKIKDNNSDSKLYFLK